MRKKVIWTPEMDEMVINEYHQLSVNKLASRLSVSKHSLLRRAKKLGLGSKKTKGTWIHRPWTELEISSLAYYVRETRLTYAQIAIKLNRTAKALENKCKEVGLCKGNKHMQWDDEKDAFLKEHYPQKGVYVKHLAEHFQCSTDSILRRVRKLGLPKKPRPTSKPEKKKKSLR